MNEQKYSVLADKLVSLKVTWTEAETWFSKVLNHIQKEYKECRSKLVKHDGQEKDRVLAQHYYDIAMFYKNLFVNEDHINLLACMKYLEISKNFSKNFPINDPYLNNFDIFQQEIDEITISVENKIPNWIQHCITFGRYNNEELCFVDINELVDKKESKYLRTVENIQLLQIINNLEDDILTSRNDKICIVFERFSMLSKAYEIFGEHFVCKQYYYKAKYIFNQLYNATNKEEDEEEHSKKILIDFQKDVESVIADDEQITLSKIIENIENKYNIELNRNSGTIIIGREYIKYCLKFWYEEVEYFIKTLIETKNDKIIIEILEKIFDVKNLLDISNYFKKLRYYNLLEQNYTLISKYIERIYISRLNKDFFKKARGYLKNLEYEFEFLEKFFDVLNHDKCFLNLSENLELVNFCNGILEFNDLIKNIGKLEITNKYYDELKKISQNYIKTEEFLLEKKFKEMIRSYLEKVEIKKNYSEDRIYLEIKGQIIIISEILEELYNYDIESVKEVRFIAKSTIYIDRNLVKDIWHGTNIIILSKKLIVDGSDIVWDLSGLDNTHKYDSNAGVDSNGDGKCGSNGLPGESGGNVLINVDEPENYENFCVISNGGNGSRGQDGGNGENGKDGNNFSFETFQAEFPPAAQFASSYNYTLTLDTINRLAQKRVKDVDPLNGYHRHIEAILSSGSLGKHGGCGGINGLGGQGGFGGEICVENLNIIQKSERGKNGDDGNCGLYGSHGKNGYDVAYADFSPTITSWPIMFGKDCESKLEIKSYHDVGPYRVWCEEWKKYIEINEKRMEPLTISTFFESRLKSGKERNDIGRYYDIMAIKQKSISTNYIKEIYSNYFQINENEIMKQMKSFMENDTASALQNVSEETEQEFKQSVKTIVDSNSIRDKLQNKSNIEKILVRKNNKGNKIYQNISSNINCKDEIDDEIRDIDNWYQLKTIPLTYKEIQETLTNFIYLKEKYTSRSHGRPQNDNDLRKFDNIYEMLIIKYRFAAFEEVGKNLKIYNIDNENEFSCSSSSYIRNRSLRKIFKIDGRHEIGHSNLGSLHQYIFKDSHNLRKQIISHIEDRKSELTESIKAFVLIDGEFEKNRSPEINKYYENYNKFIKKKNENIIRLKNELENHNEVEDGIGKEKFLEDKHFSRLSKDLNKEFDTKFKWTLCVLDGKMYKAYVNHIQTKQFSNAYFQLLSKLFEVNIVIFEKNDYNRYEILYNINEKYKIKLYLLYVDNKFIELEIDDNWRKLLIERENFDAIYGVILSKLLSFKCPEKFDDYLNYEEYKSLKSNKAVRLNPIIISNINDDIIKYFSFSSEHLLLKYHLQKILLLSKYHYNNHLILECILLRLSNEGRYISINELISIIDDILLSYLNHKQSNIFLWILYAWPQNSWTNEFLILAIENYLKQRLIQKDQIRNYLMDIDNKEILLLFKIKLEKLEYHNRITLQCIETIFYLLSNIDLEIYKLEDLSLNEWPFALKESYWLSKLKRFLNSDTENDKNAITTISYLIQQLENKSGEATSIDNFLEMVKGKISIEQLERILQIFLRLDNNVCEFDKSTDFLDSESIDRSIENLNYSIIANTNIRNMTELCVIVSNNANTSEVIRLSLPNIKKQLGLIDNKSFKFQYFSSINDIRVVDIKKWVKSFKDGLIKTENRRKFITDLRFEMLAVIDKGIELHKKFNLRNTQKLAILSMILNEFEYKNKRNTLAQASTGEGKTIIVLAITIMKALCGQKVDIITSSAVLAKRDANFDNKKIYELFDITVSHNCHESIEKRKLAYSKNQVIYGDLGNFQRDYLLDRFYMMNILSDRNFENVIVDEVDSMLLDKGNNMLYISHDICGLDKLESVYIYIWQRINQPARTLEEFRYNFNVQLIKDGILNDIFGIVKLDDIGKIDSGMNTKKKDKIWKILNNSNIIDDKGRVLIQNSITNELDDLAEGHELFHYKARIEFLLNEKINRERSIHVPKYLNSFIEENLESWIKSALSAICMKENQNYVVDVDRTESSSDINPIIIIIDNDTGTDQNNSQWDNCLHQFLQLKHCCKLSMQSLKAVFISNVSYFKLYKNLYGLTGTLGTEQERELLKKIHNVNFVTIPTSRPSQFTEYASKICISEKNWIEAIITNTKEMINNNQKSVLIICETVESVRKISKALSGSGLNSNLHTYTRDFEEFSITEENYELDGGHIIVATNLAGRGTDIKISEKLNNSGGLHVCLTYLPANERIEQQAFGRAARKGENGSGILIIRNSDVNLNNSNDFQRVYDLKRKRDIDELHRVSEIKNYYDNHIVQEENCFAKFQERFTNLRSVLDKKNVHKDIKAILLGATLDRWAFWLDENNKYIKKISDYQIKLTFEKSMVDFLNKLDNLSSENLSEWVNDLPVQAIRLGIKLLEHNQEYLKAIQLFDEVINNEPQFSEAAHYFKAYALKNQNPISYQLIENELRNARILFEDHLNNATYSSAIINKMREKNKCHFVQSDAFVKQKENICNIYYKYIESIDYILGQRITSENFTNEIKISSKLAEFIYEDLVNNGILSNPKIDRNNVKDKDIEKIAYEYGISLDMLNDFLNKLYDTEIDNMTDFQAKLEISFELPSRECFWNHLIDNQILYNDIEYIVIDMDKLSSIDEKLSIQIRIEIKKKKLRKHIFVNNSADNKLILYSEEINKENAIRVKLDDLLKIVEYNKYEQLRDARVFYLNKSANIKIDREFYFDIFDSVTANDIAKENITKPEADIIFTKLINENVISVVDGVYRLAISPKELNRINLDDYSIYKNSVVVLLKICFIYRIELEKIYNNLINNASYSIQSSLSEKPHVQLIFDLISKNIIKPYNVNLNINYIEKLKAIYKNNSDKLRNGLNDEKILESISKILQKSERKLEIKRQWHLKSILELFGQYDYGNLQEIHMFSLSGLQHLIDLKQKCSWKVEINCFILILIGMASIIIGLLLETFSAGVLNSAGLISLSEGINDINFAIAALRTDEFSWKNYSKYKLRSLSSSVITAGVGIIIKKAFKLIRFSCKVVGIDLQNDEEIPNRNNYRILIQNTCNEILNGIENGTFRGRNSNITTDTNGDPDRLIYNDAQKLLRNIKFSILDNIQDVVFKHKIPNVFDETFKILGKEKARQSVDEISGLYLSRPELFQPLSLFTRKITKSMDEIVQESSSNQNVGGNVLRRKAIDIDDDSFIWKTKTEDIPEIINMTNDILNGILNDILIGINRNEEFKNIVDKSVKVKDTENFKEFKHEILTILNKNIKEKILQILTNEMMNPVLENLNKSLNQAVEPTVEETNVDYYLKIEKLKKKFIKYFEPKISAKHEVYVDNYTVRKYQRIVLLLLAKSKSPKLFAEIISENIPMDAICLKTSAVIIPFMLKEKYNIDLNGIKIIVEQHNGRSQEFSSNPEEKDHSTIRIELAKQYYIKRKETDGSENLNLNLAPNKVTINDYLFDTLLLRFKKEISNTTIEEFRNNFADFVRNYSEMGQLIQDSYKWLKLRKTNVGGQKDNRNMQNHLRKFYSKQCRSTEFD